MQKYNRDHVCNRVTRIIHYIIYNYKNDTIMNYITPYAEIIKNIKKKLLKKKNCILQRYKYSINIIIYY